MSAAKGSLYLRSDGSTTNDRAYINTNGNHDLDGVDDRRVDGQPGRPAVEPESHDQTPRNFDQGKFHMTITTTNRIFAASTSALEALARLDETSGISGRDMQQLARRLRVLDNALQDFNKGHRVILYSNWALDAQGNRREIFKAKNEETFRESNERLF